MAKEEEQEIEAEDENKPDETILEEKPPRDPDEMVFAEQAIHHYADQVMTQFRDSIESAMSAVSGFLSSQVDTNPQLDASFQQAMATSFMDHLLEQCGGADTPIGIAMYEQIERHINALLSTEGEASDLVTDLGGYAIDATYQVEDNLESVLSGDWDNLRDLAYEGATDFIPVLHALGMPEANSSQHEMSEPMIADAQAVLDALPKKTEETIDQSQLAMVEEEQEKMDEQQEEDLTLDEEEKEAQVI